MLERAVVEGDEVLGEEGEDGGVQRVAGLGLVGGVGGLRLRMRVRVRVGGDLLLLGLRLLL